MDKNTLNKLKADDYLQELMEQSNESWFKSLIAEVIAERKVPDEHFLELVYRDFLIAQKLKKEESDAESLVVHTETSSKSAPHNFELKELKHESGVNALESGATLPFHNKLTVVYGKNGSGKSGFVRILKRVAGSRTMENIWQNVHNYQSQNDCKVEIEYVNDGKTHKLQWTGEEKVSPFVRMSIFDGRCIPIYLNSSLEFSYQPYGFELFQALSASLQDLQSRLADDLQKARDSKPNLEDIFDEESDVGKFVYAISSNTKKDDLNQFAEWDTKSQKSLAKKIKERKDLHNLDQRGEVLQGRYQKLKALEGVLEQIQTELSASSFKSYLNLIKKFNQLKKKIAVKKGKTLDDYDIPEMESQEWENFIEAGEDYINHAEHDDYPAEDDHCIYCRQKLSKTAQKLTTLYREIYKEDEAEEIDTIEEKINEAVSGLKGSFAASLSFKKVDYKKLLQEKTITACFDIISSADEVLEKLTKALEGKKLEKFPQVKIAPLLKGVRKSVAKVEGDILAANELQRNLLRKSNELDAAIRELEDLQKLSKHRIKIEKLISIERWIARAAPLQGNKLNTKPITELGKKAWQQLVSESFKERFQLEAKSLDAPTVNLDFRGEYGSQMREKRLAGMAKIDQFLSEGEQKAVALADFLSELSMQQEKAPVVFDDPATSFDHERKEKIVKRIVEQSNEHQVVVFTHDLMFASLLHRQVENPANGDLDTAKADFHNLNSRSDTAGIVTPNYYPGSTRFQQVLKKAKDQVSEIETLSGERQMSALKSAYDLLRGAIEKAVEERIFGGVVKRWTEQIQMRNITKATLDKTKLEKAEKLHNTFSGYINAHNQSDEMIQHSMPTLDGLKKDIEEVESIAAREASESVMSSIKI